MTLNLTDAEMAVLDQLSADRDMTKTAILRQALRLYQVIDDRLRAGEKLFFGDDLDKEKKELVVL
ncbi:MAG TPA: ribbon-helix-helix protein, CopG family [Gammaproteobacteria bacterium]|jgi:predicted transcriptional regulator|nr:ribbon-helix-helix protein, CopG family [Gammaproteobacteria bacterium]